MTSRTSSQQHHRDDGTFRTGIFALLTTVPVPSCTLQVLIETFTSRQRLTFHIDGRSLSCFQTIQATLGRLFQRRRRRKSVPIVGGDFLSLCWDLPATSQVTEEAYSVIQGPLSRVIAARKNR